MPPPNASSLSGEGAPGGYAAADHLGKRASGSTFSTGAEGAGGFHSARKAAPPTNKRAITMINAMVIFPMPPARNLPIPDPIGPAPIDDQAARYASTLSASGEKEQ